MSIIQPASGSSYTSTILVIDDQVTNLQILIHMLAEHQIRVLVARDGTSGIQRALHAQPDLILLDVQLPDLDGFSVCRELKANAETQHIPVIFLTAHAADMPNKLAGFAAGGVDYLTRPIQQQELLARVSVHLQLRHMTTSLQRQAEVLKREIDERIEIEAELTRYKEHLETLVVDRTIELQQANFLLRREIEERRYAEQTLQYERNLLQTILGGVSAGLALLDQHGVILIANQAMSILIDRGGRSDRGRALVGQQWNVIAPDFAELTEQAYQQRMVVSNHRFRCGRRGNQQIFDVTILPIEPILPVEAQPFQVLIHINDISEQTKLEALALQNERFAANGRLAASIAHEVNSPLQAIQNFLFLIDGSEATQRSHYLSLVNDEISRIGNMLRRLMDFQRSGDDTYQDADLHELIERILLLTSGRLAQQRIRIERHFLPSLPLVQIRPDLFTQIILNLILNAIDAMPRGGQLTITTALAEQATPTQVLVMIHDTGVGIPADVLDQIFEPFFTTKADGNGIGLAVTHHLISQLHGTIYVESMVDQGTSFRLLLPIRTTAA